MASIRISVSRGGYTSNGFGTVTVASPDVIEIDMPVPDRADSYAGNFIRPTEYIDLIEATFDKTAELVEVVRGDAIDAEIATDEEASA